MNNDMEREMLETYQPRRRRPEDAVSNVLLAQARQGGLKTWPVPDKPGFYYVQKGTGNENHMVQTQLVDDVVRAIFCDCPSWRFRNNWCKHCAAVERRLGIEHF